MARGKALEIGFFVTLAALMAVVWFLVRADAPGHVSPRAGTASGDKAAASKALQGSQGAGEKDELAPNLKFEGTVLSITEPDGDVEWVLEMGSFEVTPNERRAVLKNIKARHYRGKKLDVQIKAGRATVDWDSRDIRFDEGVRAWSGEANFFKAKEVKWNAKTGNLEGYGEVRYIKRKMTIIGEKITAEASLSRIRVEGKAKMMVELMSSR